VGEWRASLSKNLVTEANQDFTWTVPTSET